MNRRSPLALEVFQVKRHVGSAAQLDHARVGHDFRRNIDNPRRRTRGERIQEQVGEQKRRQKVDREVELDAVDAKLTGWKLSAGVIDQHMQ